MSLKYIILNTTPKREFIWFNYFTEYLLGDKMMTKDQQWIREHFEELVEKFAGRYIAVANEELLVGDSLQEVRANARRKHPAINPSILHVPHPEDFVCAL